MSNRYRRWANEVNDPGSWPGIEGVIVEAPSLHRLSGGGRIIRGVLNIGYGRPDLVDVVVEKQGTEWLCGLLRPGMRVWAAGTATVAYQAGEAEVAVPRKLLAADLIQLEPQANESLQPPCELPVIPIVPSMRGDDSEPRLPARGDDAARLLLTLDERGEAAAADLGFNYARLLGAAIDLCWLGWPVIEARVEPSTIAFDGNEHARRRLELAEKVLRSREFEKLRSVMRGPADAARPASRR